jgi:anti-anti-sigma regulatory factor
MLRITVHNDIEATSLKIEGRLMGAWVRELESCWRQVTAAQLPPRILVELTDVSFVDEEGGRLLKLMAASGVELIATDLLMKALVEEITEGGRKNEKTD